MTHSQVIAAGLVEEYILGWMDLPAAAEFERHMFACEACAADVAAGLALARNCRAVFLG